MNRNSIFIQAVLLAALATLGGIVSNLLRGESTRLAWIGTYGEAAPPSPERAAVVSSANSVTAELRALAPPKDPGLVYLEISPEIAQRLHQAGAVFLDARRSSAYRAGHIERARNLPVWEHDADAKVAALAAEGMPYDQILVVYCSGKECEDSAMLADNLSMGGFFNVYVYRDGFPDWEKRGWPVRREEGQ